MDVEVFSRLIRSTEVSLDGHVMLSAECARDKDGCVCVTSAVLLIGKNVRLWLKTGFPEPLRSHSGSGNDSLLDKPRKTNGAGDRSFRVYMEPGKNHGSIYQNISIRGAKYCYHHFLITHYSSNYTPLTNPLET